MKEENKECCPKFDSSIWDEKSFNWENKSFIKESIPAFFHIPIPSTIGKKITKMWNLAEDSKKNLPDKNEALVLFMDPHPFKSEIYLSVTGEVPGANNTPISGTFQSKVFDGAYKEIPKFFKQMNQYLNEKGKKAEQYYVHYAYCPKCAKEEGHNYMVLFAKVKD